MSTEPTSVHRSAEARSAIQSAGPDAPAKRGVALPLSVALCIVLIAYLFIPNQVKVMPQSDENLAISQAMAMNIAMESFMQANGKETARARCNTDGASESDRYLQLLPYLGYAPENFEAYMAGTEYHISLPATLDDHPRVKLTRSDGDDVEVIHY